MASCHKPMGRASIAAEMACRVAFLASPGASYITGQMMVVDVGHCLQERKGPDSGLSQPDLSPRQEVARAMTFLPQCRCCIRLSPYDAEI
ncbi:SDR family oxidoreductase [Rhodoferax sp. U11-2br]|uniref:SDR family oxidoreductase n=1 Tax=Rhodoferax sp. U11-2br TaxID=2838878 RepID=UPI001BE9045E|nr:SDR family oxidoreductase [Rhodoferax sp. U11-2br]MBT3068091.1 SDR family oxidoreductase [Rhodoferax sp. U11-2br]